MLGFVPVLRLDCRMKFLLPLFLSVSLGSSVLAASPPSNYGDALRWYEQQATAGNARAQFLYAILLQRGVFGEADDTAAALSGKGVPVDAPVAAKWLEIAAKGNISAAQFNLALLYEKGLGVEQDAARAAEYYEQAAQLGLAQAQNNLGVLYLSGIGVPQDPVLAMMWLELAVRNGWSEASAARTSLAHQMTPGQVEAAMDLVRQWVELNGLNNPPVTGN